MADGGTGRARPKTKKAAKTKQDYGTPPEFIAAVEKRFGKIDYDLAARAGNAVAPLYLDPIDDSLSRDWSELEGLAFLNPPFSFVDPWADRCARFASSRLRIVVLWQAAIDTGWFNDFVLPNAISCGVSRMKFVGAEDGYPKPLMMSLFGFGAAGVGPVWKWREELPPAQRARRSLPPPRDLLREDVAIAADETRTMLERACALSRACCAAGAMVTVADLDRWSKGEADEVIGWLKAGGGRVRPAFLARYAAAEGHSSLDLPGERTGGRARGCVT
jgi:phage N-6-adenine-methyltransferase